MLTVCVIGRNESEKIPMLIDSLKPLRNTINNVEMIYVDSASTDSSVNIVKVFFDKTIVLEESEHLCASAGRYVATLHSSGDWLLYLDGDMELCKEFSRALADICNDGAENTGWVGQNRYIYNSGRIRENAHGHGEDGELVAYFGGAVLLPKQLVLRAGNWNPSIFSNEEIELFARLKGVGGCVRYVDIPMIEHRTEYISILKTIFWSFIPGLFGKKFYGFGQVLAARIKNHEFLNLVRYMPYPFVFWAGIFASAVFLVVHLYIYALLAFFATVAFIWKLKGPQYLVIYSAFAVQGLLGFRHYDSHFRPVVKSLIQRPAMQKITR